MAANQTTSDRRVGVEIEFSGLSIGAAAEVLQGALDARVEDVSEHEILLHGELSNEPFRLEVDFELLKTMSRKEGEDRTAFTEAAIDMLDLAAAAVVPLEWITPPLLFDDLPRLLPVLGALEAAGAVGSQESWAYAFGTQFNPDLESLEPKFIVDHLRSFICLHDWLESRDPTDLTRRLTTFAKPYPESYEMLVLDPAYAPDEAALIDDYIDHNPTRNRALDMMPLFTHLDEKRLRERIDDERIKARPTFHYRLPNSRLSDPDWSVLDPWNDWLVVEALARKRAELNRIAAARLEALEGTGFTGGKDAWTAQCETWLADLELA